MDKIKRLKSDERENLVAYLDGELDENSTRVIDDALATSQVARHEVEMLTRTWEMLDLLPREKASDSFTQTTMQTALQAEKPAPSIAAEDLIPRIRQAASVFAWSAGLLFVAWGGFMLTNRWINNPADQLIEELPVVENLELYQEVGDVEFLKSLESVFKDAE